MSRSLFSAIRSILIASAIAAILPAASQALDIITLSPSPTTLTLGDDPVLAVRLELHFSNPTFGGGVDVSYDTSILGFDHFEYNDGQFAPSDPALGDNTMFRFSPPAGDLAQPLNIAAVFFDFSQPGGGPGFVGDALVGMLYFNVIGAGGDHDVEEIEEIELAPSALLGGFTAAQFGSASVLVVPEPRMLALLGLAGLALFKTGRSRR